MKKILKCILMSLSVLSTIIITSCNKLIEVPDSKSQVLTSTVFADSTSATSALLGAYSTLGSAGGVAGTPYAFTKDISLYADEYNYTGVSTDDNSFNKGQLLINTASVESLWTGLYSVIYQSNAVLEQVELSQGISLSAKTLLKSEAKFLRAYCYFYLVNLYDNIPLVLTTDVNVNARKSQDPAQAVYDQIIKDLLEAKSGLGTAYTGAGRVRANKWAASALLARVYLYQKRWNDAEKEATGVINSSIYSPLPALADVFLANSTEAILQLSSVNGFVIDAALVVPSSTTTLPQYVITDGLYQSFDAVDGRASKWISKNTVTTGGIAKNYYYPAKYKNRVTNTTKPENVMVLRLAEQYLIRAEAFAQQNSIAAAVADINIIRNRATGILPLATNLTQQACLDAVAKERRLELFGEWGQRFLDLKRTGQLDAVLGALKPGWKSTAKTFPIPQSQINFNPSLIQNNGY